MGYSEEILDHYRRPRNGGSFGKDEPGVGTGSAGSYEEGAIVKIQLKVDSETGVVVGARFKTFGCTTAIAASSLATEWAVGKTLEEVLHIRGEAIAAALKLEPEKVRNAVLVVRALKAAVEDYRTRYGGGNWSGREVPF